MKNIKKTIFKFKRITIKEMLISAFLLVLIVLSKQSFFNINFGVMRMGISYTFLIVTGLILNFFLGIVTVILGDTLALLIGGAIGTWHYAYFVIPIGIFITTFLFKSLFKIKNYKMLVLFNLTIFIALSATIVYFILDNSNFVNVSKNEEANINFTNKVLKILAWSMFGLMSFYSILITVIYIKYKTDKWKDYLIINIINIFIIIIFIWYYGPIAQILWLSDLGSGKDYWKSFNIYQIARILKTPIILPVYNFIVTVIYKVYKQIKKTEVEGW